MYRDQFGEIVCGYWSLKGNNIWQDATWVRNSQANETWDAHVI